MKVLYLLLIMQVIVVSPARQACSKYKHREQSISLDKYQDHVAYNSTGYNDYCEWQLPSADEEYDILFVHVSRLSARVEVDNRCPGYLYIGKMTLWCDTKYLGCYFYSRNSAGCKPELILKQFFNMRSNVSCEMYHLMSVDSFPSYFTAGTSTNGIQDTKSFDLEYAYLQCRQKKTTISTLQTETAETTTVAVLENFPTSADLEKKKDGVVSNVMPWIVVVALISFLLLVSWISAALLVLRYRKRLRDLTDSNPENSSQEPQVIENELYGQHIGQVHEDQGGVKRYAVGDAQDVYTVAGRR